MGRKLNFTRVLRDRWLLTLGITLPLAESIIVLCSIVAPQGYVFYGDASPIVNPWLTFRQSLSLWNFQSQSGVGAAFIWTPYYLCYAVLSSGFGPPLTSRILIVLLGALPGIVMFLASARFYQLFRQVSWPRWYSAVFSLVTSQAYELSFVNSNLTNAFNPWGITYIALPLLFWGLLLALVDGKQRGLVALAVGSLISSLNPFWIEEIIIIAIPILAVSVPKLLRDVGIRQVFTRAALVVTILTVVNLFWIIPLGWEYTAGVASYSATTLPLSYGSVAGLSQGFGLLDVLFYGHATYYSFGIWFQNWGPLSLVATVCTFIPLLTRERMRPTVLALYVSLLVGLFLSKGTNPPAGGSFYWLAERLPLGFGEFLRNGGSIFMGTVLCVGSLLIAVGVLEAAHWFASDPSETHVAGLRSAQGALQRWRRARPSRATALALAAVTLLALGAVVPLSAGMLQDQSVYGPRYVATEIPPGYAATETFLENQGFGYSVAWEPNGCCYTPYWKPDILTNFPASISYETTPPSGINLLPYLFVPGSNITGNWLSLLGVRYLVLHNDFLDFPYSEWYNAVNGSSSFDREYTSGNLTTYETVSPWVPSEVYALPRTAGVYSGFPAFNGDSFVKVSYQSELPSSVGIHNASINSFAFFNGTSTAVAPSPVNFSAGQNFTLVAWVKTNSSGTQILAQDNDYGSSWNGWVLGIADGKPFFQAGQTPANVSQALVANISIADDTWHQVVGERIGTTWAVYVDGKLVAEQFGMPSISLTSDQNASLGARVTSYGGNGWFLTGFISDVEVYGLSLSAAAISNLYSQGMISSSSPGLVAGWLLQQQSGERAPSLIPGGAALNLSNIDWIPLHATLNFGAGQDFAVGAWIRTTSPSTQVILQDNEYGSTWNGWVLGLQDGDPCFQAGQTSHTEFQGLVGNTSVANGMWTFLLGERVGSSWYLYVNGQLEAEAAGMPSIPIQTNQSASIGARVTTYGANAWYFNGAIGDVQVYSTELSQSEVNTLYRAGLDASTPPVAIDENLLYGLTESQPDISLNDMSPNSFALRAYGDVSTDPLPLPSSVGPANSSAVQVLSIASETQTGWTLELSGHGNGTIVLADPYSTGWVMKAGGQTIFAHPLFSGLAIAFNVTLEGNETVFLSYLPQQLLYVGAAVSISGGVAAVLIAAVRASLRRKHENRQPRAF